jgi:hypothetical protein
MQDTEDEPLFAERVAGLEIAKAGVDAAIRVPSDTTRAAASRRRGLSALHARSCWPWRTGCAPGASPRSACRPLVTTCDVRVLESSGRHRLEVRLMPEV